MCKFAFYKKDVHIKKILMWYMFICKQFPWRTHQPRPIEDPLWKLEWAQPEWAPEQRGVLAVFFKYLRFPELYDCLETFYTSLREMQRIIICKHVGSHMWNRNNIHEKQRHQQWWKTYTTPVLAQEPLEPGSSRAAAGRASAATVASPSIRCVSQHSVGRMQPMQI